MANQILPVFAQTQREYCAQFGHVFTLKSVFTNCSSDFSIKNYARLNHGLLYVSQKINLLCTKNMPHTCGTAHDFNNTLSLRKIEESNEKISFDTAYSAL